MAAEMNHSKIDELRNSYNELSSINEKQEKRVRFLETRAINLVYVYCFFQAIIFLCISQPSISNNISCHNRWTPFCLSLLMSIISGLTFTTTITKLSRTQYQYELSSLELETIHYQIFLCQNNQAQNLNEYQGQRKQVLKPDMFKVYRQYAYFCVLCLALVAFTVVILRANWSIPCDR